MKKIINLIIVVAIVVVLAVTCPDKKAHTEALQDLVETMLKEEISNKGYGGLASIGSFLGGQVGSVVIDKILTVDNYLVVSVGSIEQDGEKQVVSLGILNHVFAPSPDDVREAMAKEEE